MLSLRTGRADIWLAYVDSAKPPRQITRDVRDDFSPRWSSDGRYIAFISNRGRQFDVWVADVHDGTETRVTDSPITESETPQWIPGTHSLLVISDSSTASLWIRDLSSGSERQLTPDSLRVSGYDIHPQGKQVAFAIDRGGGIHDLAVLSIEGGAPRTLISGGGTVARPEWSPDGSTIAFASDRSGIGDIWSLDTAGTLRRRTDWAGVENAIGWTRDGSYYFMSDSSVGFADIWALPPDGGQPRQVTRDGSIVAASVRRSSDKVFAGTNSIAAGRSSLARVEHNGTLAALWDRSEAGPYSPSPSGDSLLIWVEDAKGQEHNGIIGARGGLVTFIGQGPADWSPDGRMIAYSVVANGSRDLAMYMVADSSRRVLTNTPEQEGNGRFTPDGKSIVFTRGIHTVRVFKVDLDDLMDRRN